MDDIELATLARELGQDCVVAAAADALARQRIAEASPSGYEGCAHHLARLYNVVEQMGRRVAKVFENTIDDEKGWHSELIRRLTLDIPGVRPALWPEPLVYPLRELRAFRHVFTHAYDLTLDPDKLRLLLTYAGHVAPRLNEICQTFVGRVATMHGLTLPPN
jgi:hypothetical protein